MSAFAKWQKTMARKKASKVVLNQLFTMSGPVQLKLQPFGRLGYHEYRLVAMRTDLDAITGAPYEVLGYFDPYARKDLHSPETPQAYDRMTYRKVLLDFDRAKWWLMQGATATQEVQTLLSMAGIMPSPLSQSGHRHLQRFNWGSKKELYQYFLKNRRPAAEMAAEDRYNYYDSADGQHTAAGKRDAEREEARTRVHNQLSTATGIRQQLLGTREQRDLARWQGPVGSLPRSRFVNGVGPAAVMGKEF
eukprot:Rhum_TRINITY_DN16466_c0_g1::Rhum_TRINITY_DN16466_c0_g1_i1::g.163253::m.163253